MSFDVQTVHSIEEISQEAWDCLGKNCPFGSYRWYQFGETVLTDNTPVYIILSQQGQPVARGTFWLKTREPLPIRSTLVQRFMREMMSHWPLFICRSPLTSVSGLILPEPPLRDQALRTIAQIALEEARRFAASFLVFDYLERQEAMLSSWPNAFLATQVPDPGTYLAIKWPDFESYVAHLPKSARKDYRRHRNRAADFGIEITHRLLVEPLDEETINQSMTLIKNVDEHHGSPSHPYGRTMLENAHMIGAIWLTALVEDRLVGCGLIPGDGDIRFLALLGLDYKVKYAYFQMAYTAIHSAIENGVKVLRGGSGTYDLKQRLGFQLEGNNYVTFAGIGPVFQRFGRWAMKVA
jgi:predicted N-acyltransferase